MSKTEPEQTEPEFDAATEITRLNEALADARKQQTELADAFAAFVKTIGRKVETDFAVCKTDILRSCINAVLDQPNDAASVELHYDFLYPSDGAAEMRPEYLDGRLWLRFAPKPSPLRNVAVSIGAGEVKRLATGVRLRVPEGYAALICRVEQSNGGERLTPGDVMTGHTQEVEVTYRSAEHMYIHPKRIIGCVLLVPVAKYVAAMSQNAGQS
jgi:hypothetical protein